MKKTNWHGKPAKKTTKNYLYCYNIYTILLKKKPERLVAMWQDR